MKEKAILIIDDEFIILESLRMQLMRILPPEIILESATSGDEATQIIDVFHEQDKDLLLVISDFHLDDMKGTEILKHAVVKYPKVQKVILTGQANAELIDAFDKEFGLTAILHKPWEFADICDVVQEVLK